MKYKNITLGTNEEDELLVVIELDKPNKNLVSVKKMRSNLNNLLKPVQKDLFIEFVRDDMVEVRYWDESNNQQGISFNQQGINLLKMIHDSINGKIQGKVLVGVVVGGYDMFKRKDGTEYNEDVVSWDEFIANLEY